MNIIFIAKYAVTLTARTFLNEIKYFAKYDRFVFLTRVSAACFAIQRITYKNQAH